MKQHLQRLAIAFTMATCLTPYSGLLTAVDHFPFEIPKNFSLFIGEDRAHHPVTTSVPAAQDYFDQGLTLVYAFNHDASYWSFKRAAELDPNLAMAYWGMALSLGTNINIAITANREETAYPLSQKALKLSESATDNEKAYIQALVKRYSDDPKADQTKLAQAYHDAMKKVMDQYPDDLDAATLFAESGMNLHPWVLWDNNGKPREGTLEIVETLESVLKRNPDHLGANHYYIHAIEASSHPERGLMSAWRLSNILRNLGHIVHMPAHIYLRVGDYHKAATANEKAVSADRAYIHLFGLQGIYPLHYLTHNLAFLSYAYVMEGRFTDAKRAADDLNQLFEPYLNDMPNLEDYLPNSLFVLIRFHKWPEILKVPAFNSNVPMATSMWHFSRGMAFAALGDLQQAKEEQKLFLAARKQIPSNAKFGNNKAETIMGIADMILKAQMSEAQNDRPRAIKILREAVMAEDNLDYNEPPEFTISAQEILGGILLRDRQYKESESVFRKELEKHPRYGRALFGLLESLKAQSKHTDAFWINEEFLHAWRYSTAPLTIDDL